MSLDGGVPASAPLASLRGASSLSFQGAWYTKDIFHFEELSISDFDYCHFQLLLRDIIDIMLLLLYCNFEATNTSKVYYINYNCYLASHKGWADLL